MAGQISGMVKEIKPAKDIIESIINEAHEVLKTVRVMEKEE
jgi:NAD(P)H-dependent flavin oxidoreductase YrpB (nitropropane dioxygenase family)